MNPASEQISIIGNGAMATVSHFIDLPISLVRQWNEPVDAALRARREPCRTHRGNSTMRPAIRRSVQLPGKSHVALRGRK